MAAAKAGKAAQDQLVQLAKDHLKQKGIYAPAAMCQEDNLPCPGTLRSQETSTGHYAPVRDNGPAPGEQMKSVQKKEKKLVMPAPARYPAVSFYAKVREEMSSAEKARLSAEPSHKTALEMLAPGEHEHRPNRGVEEHREREERRDDEKRREEDTLRREQSHEKSLHELHAEERREEARKVDTDHSIGNHLYKLFIAHSGGSNRRDERQLESETRPSADELKNRDSIRSVEGSKLYEDKMSDDDEEDPEEEERQKKMRGELRVKQAQERMAAQWRDTMAHPPRRSARTRPDMLDPRELVMPELLRPTTFYHLLLPAS